MIIYIKNHTFSICRSYGAHLKIFIFYFTSDFPRVAEALPRSLKALAVAKRRHTSAG